MIHSRPYYILPGMQIKVILRQLSLSQHECGLGLVAGLRFVLIETPAGFLARNRNIPLFDSVISPYYAGCWS